MLRKVSSQVSRIWPSTNTSVEVQKHQTQEKKLEETLRRRFGMRLECLGDEEIELSRERSREIRFGSHEENI